VLFVAFVVLITLNDGYSNCDTVTVAFAYPATVSPVDAFAVTITLLLLGPKEALSPTVAVMFKVQTAPGDKSDKQLVEFENIAKLSGSTSVMFRL